ncbi:DUF6660 family protein [Pedobacter sp. AW31-3R]|uniref:DUF6660 family protein n=1 Tax=Pedobacter sp. AW31-3R TaxID=3445781 RepID=UPI003FA076E1
MKLFSLICVVIVLVLNFVPCADAQETIYQHSSVSAQHPETNHSHGLTDNCTPFCHCSCCAASSVAQLFYLTVVPLPEINSTLIPYTPGRDTAVALPIWQPPQWC